MFQRFLMSCFGFVLLSVSASADEGHPVAVRCWPGGAVSIETMWDLTVVIDPDGSASQDLKQAADFVAEKGLSSVAIVDRAPNATEVTVNTGDDQLELSSNAITVRPINNAKQGTSATNGLPSIPVVQVDVDGVSLLVVDCDQLSKDGSLADTLSGKHDTVVLKCSDPAILKQIPVVDSLKKVTKRFVLIHSPAAESSFDIKSLQTLFGEDLKAKTSLHNTFAVSSNSSEQATTEGSGHQLQIVRVGSKPAVLPEELASLFKRMEMSCEESQTVFQKLSVNQMNFKPSNGTHTPRWNTEHMMGRQLVFFSQIYNHLEPAIPIMNLNPKQMPKDYVFAHADWTGTEEALQMQRVSRFTRRFAYLIADLDVNKRAPASRWPSLKALLLQMERHYSEHTANTVKKFELPNFPKK